MQLCSLKTGTAVAVWKYIRIHVHLTDAEHSWVVLPMSGMLLSVCSLILLICVSQESCFIDADSVSGSLREGSACCVCQPFRCSLYRFADSPLPLVVSPFHWLCCCVTGQGVIILCMCVSEWERNIYVYAMFFLCGSFVIVIKLS